MPKIKADRQVDENVRTPTQVGGSVAFEVRGGGATGFAWEPTEPLPSGVTIEKERSVQSPQYGIGGMGKELLKFSFSEPGKYDLSLGFTSPSGNEVVERKKFKFDVE